MKKIPIFTNSTLSLCISPSLSHSFNEKFKPIQYDICHRKENSILPFDNKKENKFHIKYTHHMHKEKVYQFNVMMKKIIHSRKEK